MRFLLLMPLFGVMTIAGCDYLANHEELVPAKLDMRTVPQVDLQPDNAIVAADLADGDGQTLHVVWNAAVQETPGTLSRHASLYVRSKDGGNTWSPPTVIDRSFGAPQIVTSEKQLHVVTGPRLIHLMSGDGGKSWTDLGPVLPKAIKGNVVCDLTNIDASSHALVCLIHPRTPYDRNERGIEHRQRVLFGYLPARGEAKLLTIGTFPSSVSAPPPPRLVVADGVLHVLVGVNEDRWQQVASDGNAPTLKVVGRMYTFRSDDGRTWSNAVEFSKADGQLEPIEAVEGLAVKDRLYAFFSAHGVFFTRSANGEEWSVARQVSPYRTGIAPGGPDSSLLSAAVSPEGKGWIAWIDERYRRSAGRWWNPLGGLPWSDDTQLLRNNDVFTLDISQVDDLLLRGGKPYPLRVTSPMGFARLVRLEWAGDQFVVLWAGRREVGKQLASKGFSPEIFYSFFGAGEGSSQALRHAK